MRRPFRNVMARIARASTRLAVGAAFVAPVLVTAIAYAEGPAVPAGSPGGEGPAGVPGLGGGQGGPGMMATLFPFILIMGVMFLFVIRPQQKKHKEQQEMLNSLKHGDEILTASGILGTITGITDKVVTVEVAENVRLKMLKSQISQVIKGQIPDLKDLKV